MSISEPSKLVIENVDWLKSTGLYLKDENGDYLQKDVACRWLKNVAYKIALFFCKLFHFLKTGVWITDQILFDKVKLRIQTIKSFELDALSTKEERDELTRIYREMYRRVESNKIPTMLTKNPFGPFFPVMTFEKDSLKEAKLDFTDAFSFVWSDDVEFNKKQFPNKIDAHFDPDVTLLDGSPIPFKHGDYVVPVKIKESEKINEIFTYLPTRLLQKNDNRDFKLLYKNQILSVAFPIFEELRNVEIDLCKTHSYGSPKGAFSIKYLEFENNENFNECLFSSKRRQFLPPTILHKRNLTEKPLPLSKECIRLDEVILRQDEYSNAWRNDYTMNKKGKYQIHFETDRLVLKKGEASAKAEYDCNSGYLIAEPASTINISLFEDFMYVYCEWPQPDEIMGHKIIGSIKSDIPNSFSYIHDKRQGYLKDQIDIANVSYKDGMLYIPLK